MNRVKRIPLSEVLERLGPDGSNSRVHVARQPGGGSWDDGGWVTLSALSGFHTRTRSGGRNDSHYFAAIYAYGSCTKLPVGHSGRHGGECPHQILACVTDAESDDVWDVLCDLTGHQPPTEEEIKAEQEQVKLSILRRLDATQPAPGNLQAYEPTFSIYDIRVDAEIGPLISAWLGDDAGDFSYYFDRESGEVFLDAELSRAPSALQDWYESYLEAAWDDKPDLPNRFEELRSFDEAEIDLLTLEDLREIRDAFLASRGFVREKS